MQFTPINGQILICLHPVKEDVRGGIFISSKDTESSLRGTVVALGCGRRAPDGSLIPFDVRVDDTVLVMKYGPVDLKFDDNSYLVAGEEHILGILE